MRIRGRHRRTRPTARWIPAALVILAAGGLTGFGLSIARLLEQHSGRSERVAVADVEPRPVSARLQRARPVFRYSVIPGGVYSPGELRNAVQADAIVAAHYRGLDASNLRVIRSSFAKPVYVSYRKDGEVYWTRKPVTIAKGEALLTDGKLYARARCGNQISEEARAPVAPDSPAEPQLDQVEPELLQPGDEWIADAPSPDSPLSDAPLPDPPQPGGQVLIASLPRGVLPRPELAEAGEVRVVTSGVATAPVPHAMPGVQEVPTVSARPTPAMPNLVETPEPGSVLMFGLGIAVLAGLSRRAGRR